jgi:hypothetical protein
MYAKKTRLTPEQEAEFEDISTENLIRFHWRDFEDAVKARRITVGSTKDRHTMLSWSEGKILREMGLICGQRGRKKDSRTWFTEKFIRKWGRELGIEA